MALDRNGRPIPVHTPAPRKRSPQPDPLIEIRAALANLEARVAALEKKG